MFRSPCRNPEHTRTLRRRPDGVVVAVRLSDRPFAAVQADLVDSFVATNDIAPAEVAKVREELWCALERAGQAE